MEEPSLEDVFDVSEIRWEVTTSWEGLESWRVLKKYWDLGAY